MYKIVFFEYTKDTKNFGIFTSTFRTPREALRMALAEANRFKLQEKIDGDVYQLTTSSKLGAVGVGKNNLMNVCIAVLPDGLVDAVDMLLKKAEETANVVGVEKDDIQHQIIDGLIDSLQFTIDKKITTEVL